MKLLRHGPAGEERPGLLDTSGTIRDLSGEIDDLAGAALDPDRLAALAALDPSALPAVEGDPRIGPCVGRVPDFHCIGLNYKDHAEESGMELPSEPVVFSKATSAVAGPHDDLKKPAHSTKVDWEVELGVVIGRRAYDVAEAAALDHVAGYCVVNDLSERAFQLESTGQWVKGKSCPGYGPIGPWLVTKDEIPDPQALRLWLEVDGEMRQDSNTSQMEFGVTALVSYVSRFMVLEPGTVISTGTPPGVGLGFDPPVYLQVGQTMRLGVDGLGEQRQRLVD